MDTGHWTLDTGRWTLDTVPTAQTYKLVDRLHFPHLIERPSVCDLSYSAALGHSMSSISRKLSVYSVEPGELPNF